MHLASAFAGQLQFDGVPVDITSSANEDVVVAPGEGGVTQVGDKSGGTRDVATTNDDLFITNHLEVEGKERIEGALTVGGATTLNGAVTLGDATSDDLTATGRFASGLVPKTDSTYDLGSTSLAWANLYVDTIASITGNDLALAPVSGKALTAAVTRSAATGDEVAYDLAATVNKATSGSYTGLKLNVTETAAPGSADRLLDLLVGGTSRVFVSNGATSANYGMLSVGTDDWDGSTSGFFAGSGSGTLIAGNAISGFVGNVLDLQVAGTSAVKVDYAGNLTIPGTLTAAGTSTGENLTLTGNLSVQGNTTLGNAAADTFTVNAGTTTFSSSATGITFAADTAVTLSGGVDGINFDTNTLSIDATNDRVGIGTAAPGAKLFIDGSADVIQLQVQANATQTSNLFVLEDSAGTDVFSVSGSGATWTFPQDTAVTLSGGVNGINFDSNTLSIDATNDRVGIGNAAPTFKMEVTTSTGEDGIRLSAGGSGSTYLLFYNSSGTQTGSIGGIHTAGQGTTTTSANDTLVIGGQVLLATRSGSTNTERVRLDSDGELGIGATTVSDNLHISESDAGTTTVLTSIRQERLTSGIAAAGLGVAQDFYLEDAGGSSNQAARIDVAWEDATNLSEDASIRFNQMVAGTLTEAMRIDDAGLVGIGDTSPAALLTVGSGDLFQVNSNGSLTQAQAAVSGGQLAVSLTPGAHTAMTAEVSDLAVLAHTDTITGAITTQRFSRFMRPTISAATALTVTNAATVYIENAPATGGVGPAAITNAYALWVDDGAVQLDGNLTVAGTVTQTGNATFSGNLSVNGNTTLGDASGDTMTWNAATWTVANATTVNLADSQAASLNFESGLLDLDTSNTRVGIADASPDYKLEVSAALSADSSFALSDADVAHGLTTIAQTDVWALVAPISSTAGGAQITALTDADGQSMELRGVIGAINPTDTTPAVKIIGAISNGTTGIADMAAAETVFQVANNDNTAELTLMGNGALGLSDQSPDALLDAVSSSGFNGVTLRVDQLDNDNIAIQVEALNTTADVIDVQANSLTTGIGMQITSSTLSTGSLFDLTTTSTAAGANTQKGFNVAMSGTNTSASQTTYGGYISNTHGGSGTNVGLYATASGGTNNYAGIFDAGRVGIGTTTPNGPLQIVNTSAGAETTALSLTNLSDTASTAMALNFQPHSTGTTLAKIVGIRTAATNGPTDLAFHTYDDGITPSGLNERMRIKSTGLVGIGTTAPLVKLHATTDDSATATVTNILQLNHSSSGTPAASFGTGLLFTGESTTTDARNMAQVQSIWTTATDASRASALQFQTLTAAGSLTTQMTIDGSGNVGIGDTTPDFLLDVAGTLGVDGNTTLGDASGDTVTVNAAAWTLANDTTVALSGGVDGINFDSNTLSIDATNNRVGIRTAAPSGLLDVTNTSATTPILVSGSTTAGASDVIFRYVGDETSAGTLALQHARAASSSLSTNDRMALILGMGHDGTDYESGAAIFIEVDGTPGNNDMPGRFEIHTTADGTNSLVERMRIDNVGNVGINATSFGTSAVAVLAIATSTAPSSSITDGIQLFAVDVGGLGHELRVRDESGNVTTLSPHAFPLIPGGPSEPMAWAFQSERDGRVINVDMLKVVRTVEQLSGESLVYLSPSVTSHQSPVTSVWTQLEVQQAHLQSLQDELAVLKVELLRLKGLTAAAEPEVERPAHGG